MTPVATIAGLTFVLASLLVLANRWLHVAEDPRVITVESMLPHTNCGQCGYPGCRPFAEALIAGDVLPGRCAVSTPEAHTRIAEYLGVEVGATERRVARLACAGGTNVSRNHAQYEGWPSCAAATVVAGGGKGCFWGCLGYGDCVPACTFDAIQLNAHCLPEVNEQQCTGCGDCVVACPKDLFSLLPQSQRLWVACRSQEAGDELLQDCQVACTACGRCAQDAPEVIHMQDNLPVIDRSQQVTSRTAIQHCPTGAIVWLDEKLGPIKGPAARKIIRQGALNDAAT